MHVAQVVRSYRDLPLILYHFQTKGRDEPRPRAGVLRTREFIMKDAYTFDRDDEGLEASLREAHRRLRPHLRPLRPGVVLGRVRRRADGRHGRARVHGAVPGGRERRRAGARLRGQRRGRQRRPAARAGRGPRAASCTRPAPTTIDAVAEQLGVAARQPAQGLPGRHRVARARPRLRARRPPRQRDQARQRARRALPARRARTSCAGPAGFLGPTPEARDAARRRDRAPAGLRRRRQPARLPPSSPSTAASAPTSARSRRATRSTATRSGSSPRSRSATSSSSAPATPSRSARPTSTRTARSS